MENNNKLVNGIDFVVCNICNFHAQNLSIHLKKIHNINKDEYDGDVISRNSHDKYSENHFQYLKHAKDNNIDLTEYWQKVGDGVRDAILANPEELARRAEVMTKVNQSDIMRQKASDTAKVTSARPEIVEQRTIQLKNWRDNNPDDFYKKCIKKMITSFQSKPEKILFELCSALEEFNFKRNQFVNSEFISNKSKNKQVDIGDKAQRVYIEFDGIIHFAPKFGEDKLKNIQQRDNELELHIQKHKWTLIRISYDQFIYKSKMINKKKEDCSYFKQECLDKLIKILNSKIPGIYKIGKAYG